MQFVPNYRNIMAAAKNTKPQRLPLYEHIISPEIMERVLGERFAQFEYSNDQHELRHFFKHYCRFFKTMTYDTVSYEFPIVYILPAQGAGILGKTPGPIQSRIDFNSIDWDLLVEKYIQNADEKFRMLGKFMPEGMKAVGGVANGVFEISEDLVGLEHLAYMQVDDPQLFNDVFCKIGDLMCSIWDWFLKAHGDLYCVCRFGDDLGYKSGLLTSPNVVRNNIIPQYKRIIDAIHNAGKPFLWHSCGNLFSIMDEVIDAGIDAKHSNEDIIAPYSEWIRRYSKKIGLFGGIDVGLLCQESEDHIYRHVFEMGITYRNSAQGFALGSGNSIPNYVPVNGYLAMVGAAQDIRKHEGQN